MKKILLIFFLIFTSLYLFSFEIVVEKKKFDANTSSILREPLKISIVKKIDENINYNDLYVKFEKICGDILFEKDSLNFQGPEIEIIPKTGKKPGTNLVRANIFYRERLIESIDFKIILFNWFEIFVTLLGGLGLFLFGMKFMSESLQNFAGEKIKFFITKITKNTFSGILTGTVITSLIQSSSATTVITVGLVNAGLMTLSQSIGIIMGANIGTTMTAQLIAFKLESLSLPAITAGVIMILFGSRKIKIVGETIFGFGLLFYGISLMSSSISPLKESHKIVEYMVKFEGNPFLAMLSGMILTFIVQSSSGTVGLTMVLATQELITINTAIPLILGENIGTTITALIASISSNTDGKRAAIIHTLFNMMGVSYMMFGIYFLKIDGIPIYYKFLDIITPGKNLMGENVGRFIANSHTLFNVFNTIILLPFASFLEKISKILIKDKKTTKENFFVTKYLDKNLLLNPHLALYNVKKEMVEMIKIACDSINFSTDYLVNGHQEIAEQIRKYELKTDFLQNEITNYLISISKEELSDEEFAQIPVLIHSINDIERIGDQSINILEFANFIKENDIKLPQKAYIEIKNMNETLQKMISEIILAIEDMSYERINNIFIFEEELNDLEKKYNREHLLRLSNKICESSSAAVFTDILTSYERSGDHITNIAEAIKNKFQWGKDDKV